MSRHRCPTDEPTGGWLEPVPRASLTLGGGQALEQRPAPGRVVPVQAPAEPATQPRVSWWRSLALRNRMALLVAVTVMAAIAVVAGVAIFTTGIVLRRAIDDQLVSQARVAAAPLTYRPGRQPLLTFGMPLQVIDENGQILATTIEGFGPGGEGVGPGGEGAGPGGEGIGPGSTLPRLPVNAADISVAQGTNDANIRTISIGGASYRLVTVPTPRAPGFALQLARSTSDIDRTMRYLGMALVIVGAVGVGGAALLGWFVARAGLKPVDDVAAAAEQVERTQDLSALIPVVGDDEIARLATSLNNMLGALEASKRRQRQLVDDASHELRTPLTSLRTNIELLMRAEANPDRALPPEDRAALLRDVDAQMRELSGLVTELVELARDEAAEEEPEPTDFAGVVEAAAERVRRRAKTKDVTIEVALGVPAGPSPIIGRPHMLERAVTNLLDNAVKFSPPQGRVRVALAAGELVVDDEGPGIAPEDRTKVFDRFYRAASARPLPGSGLGLAIVAEAVAAHGGQVRAEAAPGGGARMRMRLPLAGPPRPATLPGQHWYAAPPSLARPGEPAIPPALAPGEVSETVDGTMARTEGSGR
jgi:two-component system sensor histidine kinase MprB